MKIEIGELKSGSHLLIFIKMNIYSYNQYLEEVNC